MEILQRAKYFLVWLPIFLTIFFSASLSAENKDIKIHLTKSKASVYKLLNMVSEQSGLLFIYDSPADR